MTWMSFSLGDGGGVFPRSAEVQGKNDVAVPRLQNFKGASITRPWPHLSSWHGVVQRRRLGSSKPSLNSQPSIALPCGEMGSGGSRSPTGTRSRLFVKSLIFFLKLQDRAASSAYHFWLWVSSHFLVSAVIPWAVGGGQSQHGPKRQAAPDLA